MIRPIKCLILLLILNALLIPAATPAYAENEDKLDKVVLQLRWDPQFQFSGYYQALWQGFYEEEGLEVEIRHGFDERRQVLRPTEEVISGRALRPDGTYNVGDNWYVRFTDSTGENRVYQIDSAFHARSGQVNVDVAAGAMIAGAYFGDRCSPMSSSDRRPMPAS